MIQLKKGVCCFFLLLSSFLYAQTSVDLVKTYSDSLRFYLRNLKLNKANNIILKVDSLSMIYRDDLTLGMVNKLKGNYYYRVNDYQKSMKSFLDAAVYFEGLNDSIEISKAYNNVSLILNISGQYNKSLSLRKKAINYCIKSDTIWRVKLLYNIASSYRLFNKIDSSFFYLKQSYDLAKKIKSKDDIARYYHSLSINYLKLKNFEEAVRYADTVQKKYREYVSRPMLENSIYYSAESFFYLKEYHSALSKAKESLNMILESGMSINAADTYELISKIYEKLGNHKKSLENIKTSNTFRDSIFNLEKNKAIIELEKKYETEKKEKENLILKEESSKKDLTIIKKNNFILFGSLIFLLVIVLLVSYQLKRFKKKNKDLKKSIIEREKIEKELDKVRENIAEDFHDGLGNKLARINVLSDYSLRNKDINLNQLKEALKSIRIDSEILFRETRDFIFSLNSQSDYIEELFTYISDFGEDFFSSFKIDFFIWKKIEKNVKLPYYWNKQIILIFKEAMTNVIKHSKASEVSLMVLLKDDLLILSLKDNGNGFDYEKLKRKNGLLNMKKRASKINAKLFFISSENNFEVRFEAKINK